MTSYSPSLQHLQKAYDLIVEEQILVDCLISHTCSLEDVQHGMTLYQTGDAMKVFVTL